MGTDENVDSLIVIFTPPLVTRADDVARSIIEAVQQIETKKPVLSVFLSAQDSPKELRTEKLAIPSYSFPETAAIALARATRYAQWRERRETYPPRFPNIRTDQAASVVAAALARGEGWLMPEELVEICSCYGLPLIEQRVVSTVEEAAVAAAEIGGEIALKAIAPGLLHKTEAGAVRLRLQDPEAVRAAASEMRERLSSIGHSLSGFVVQKMAKRGIEMLVGVVHDPQFGPVVACGAGGVQVELLKDVSVRLSPLSNEDASEMIRELRTYPLLNGFRGSAPADIRALEEALLRVSAMVEDLPQIAEFDCNPFVVHETGATILDSRIRVKAVEPRPLIGIRR